MLKSLVVATLVGTLLTATLVAQNELAEAIKKNSLMYLEQVLESNPELANQSLGENFGNHSPPGYCVRRKNVEFCQRLIDFGADVNRLDLNDMSPLMIAAWDANSEFISFLLDRGADVNLAATGNIHGRSAIDFAAKSGDIKIVELLLDHEADLSQSQALEYALHGDYIEIAELLLERGTDPNYLHAMFVAAERAPLDLLEKMIELGGDVNAQQFYGNVLGRAAASAEKTELLIRHGADVNASKQNGHRALHNAAFNGNLDVVKLLVASGADIDVQKVDEQRPLDIAIWRGHLPLVRVLVESGARPNIHSMIALNQIDDLNKWLSDRPDDVAILIPGSSGTVPIHTAIRFGNIDALKILMSNGADADAAELDVSALHLAVTLDNVVAAEQLLKFGANINATLTPERYGTGLQTPLHFAVSGFFKDDEQPVNLQMVELLLQNGANPLAADEMHKTPLENARSLNNEPLMSLFRKFEK